MGRQVVVFVENKPGKISRITGILADAGVSLRASNIADSGSFGILKLIADDNDRAYAALKEAGFLVSFQPVVEVEIPDEVGAFHRIAEVLEKRKINIEDVYCILLHDGRKAALILKVSDPAGVEKILRRGGYRTVDEHTPATKGRRA